MMFFMLIINVNFIFFIHYITKWVFKYGVNHPSSNKRYLNLLQFVKFAPLIALLVLFVLVLTTLHTKAGIRLSHAWYAAQFWAYYTFLFCSYMITKKKFFLFSMIISLLIAIYNTPLFHFENLFIGHYVVVADIFGTLMFINLWIAISKILVKMKNK
ncbi:hypothetical protein [Bacillus pseudomycoides]|uniref:hypothetical protein n=1 Tax=Bacillus pseudomycoides TaxID=64104 RepID=UPI000BEF605A|nr:hypothetical protein [Bacillus pseudomycoides]PEI32143.1 hypothetical protein CN641_30490 [Bacillus pseudomycoides]PEJ28234.1 hypothetical protein CN677_27320 [Bacillus pseudomycoides]PGA65568.1 hypothetical protein COL87_27015 [Bacillus pseudomycoides]PHA95999.1 hypothetical protein COE78_07535 [Bacillus pseudomycoides]PHC78898.1 hypothetical protein COF38_03845 [Bacillus pseudomycoides]